MHRIGTSPFKTSRTAYQALGNGGNLSLGRSAEYRREHYVFARTQSLAMRQAEWEARSRPLRSWGMNAVADIAWRLFG